MQINLLHKVLCAKLLIYQLKKNYFDNKILQDKRIYIYHKLNMEVSLPQIIITKNHTKTDY